jgi:hypothetical protein
MNAASSTSFESHSHAPRIAFLTGRSDPSCCALSPVQRAILETLAADATGLRLDPLNFPWNEHTRAWCETPLLRASVANGRQYLAARRGGFADLSQDVVAHARDCLHRPSRSLLLVGSCGLSLLDALIAPFDDRDRARLRIIAYGAVAPRWPNGIEGVHVRGHRDRIAAWLGPNHGPAARMIECGHMDYLERQAARDTILDAARMQLSWLRGDT